MDLNYILKTLFIIINFLITLSSLILVTFTIYLLTTYIYEPVCRNYLIYFFANSILLPLSLIISLLVSCGFICDTRDTLGKKNVILSLLSLPIYLINFFVGLYFNFIDANAKSCIEEQSSHTHIIYVAYKLLFSYSIFISFVIIGSLLYRRYIVKKYKTQLYNSPSLKAQRLLIEGEIRRESLEIELLDLNNTDTNKNNESLESPTEVYEHKHVTISIPTIFIDKNKK